MERRDFLKAPALGLLYPGALAIGGLAGCAKDSGTPDASRQLSQRLHQDFETYIQGVEYFLLGNGEIQAVLQYAPEQDGEQPLTFVGLTMMDANRFGRKWSSFFFHPEAGFSRSMATVIVEGKPHRAAPGTVSTVGWAYPDGVPTVRLEWRAGSVWVREEFGIPSEGRYLIRRFVLTNSTAERPEVKVALSMVPNFTIFDDIGVNERDKSVDASGFGQLKFYALEDDVATSGRYDLTVTCGRILPAGTREIVFVYQLSGGPPALTAGSLAGLQKKTVASWRARNGLSTGDSQLDHLFSVARTGLRSGISRNGKRDSGIWQYNMEWVRDDMSVMNGLLHAGFPDEARAILVKTLEINVGHDGRTIESSRWFGHDLTELDQNGVLLYGLWSYTCWTGDRELVRKYWDKITLVADFPLQEVFWDKKSGMVRNLREYWERGGAPFGVEDGFELAYQLWVLVGLEKAAAMAMMMGDRAAAERWTEAARAIKHGMLEDKTFQMVEQGRLIKRRKRNGEWQQYFIPSDRKGLPKGSPLATNEKPVADPDTSSVYPIIYDVIDPRGDLSKSTLESMELLWNQSWGHGGYSRYNTTSEPDPPAPWPLTTVYLASAFLEAGMHEKAWRALRWVHDIFGGKSGSWFERMGPSITPPAPPVGIVGWVWAEIILLFVRHMAGFRPELDRLVIRPRLLEGVTTLDASLNVRGATIDLSIRRDAKEGAARIDGKDVALTDGTLVMDYPSAGTKTRVELAVA